MKKILIFLSVVLLWSCEKVIDVDLNSADPKMVLETNVRAYEDSLWINLSNTADYFGKGDPPGIDGAEIMISNTDGFSQMATPMGNGRYLVSSTIFRPNHKYAIRANVGGELTTAEAFMPEPVLLDTMYLEFLPANDFVEDSYIVNLAFQDPGDEVNFYRLVIYVNGHESGDLTVFDDRFNQGTYVRLPVYGIQANLGDEVRVELRSIDEGVYTYYLTLASILSQNGPPGIAPGNPITNLKGEIELGYFGAYSYSSLRDTVR